MANSAACSTISAITQRLKRQSLLTPTAGLEQRLDDVINETSSVPVPPPRRSVTGAEAPKSKPRTKFQRSHKEFGDVPRCQDRPIPDENAGPSPQPRLSLTRPPAPIKSLPPRPTQSSGMPRLSVRAFQALPSTPNGSASAELPTGGATVRRELSNSACEARPGPGSPPLAPPVKRFCRSLTEGLPRPKPLRPAALNTAEPPAPSEDHMRSLIAARRLRRTAASEDSTLPLSSSFVPYPRGGSLRFSLDAAASFPSTLSSGYGSSSTASLLETTLGAVEPELAEIEAQAAGSSSSGGERPHAPSPDSRDPAFEPLPPPPPPSLPLLRSNPAVMKEKYEGDKVYRLVAGKYVVDRNQTGEDFFPKGSCCLLPGRPGRPKSPVSAPGMWVPCLREDSEGEEEEEEEEEELTLMEQSRRGSRGDFTDLDVDSMEKDDSWPL